MSQLPFMPVEIDAFLADTTDLTNGELGAYWRLCMRWWREKALPQPSERVLCRWARLELTDFDQIRPFLYQSPRGWCHRKMFSVYADRLTTTLKAGISAQKRWGVENLVEKTADLFFAYSDRDMDVPPKLLEYVEKSGVDANALRAYFEKHANAQKTDANASEDGCERRTPDPANANASDQPMRTHSETPCERNANYNDKDKKDARGRARKATSACAPACEGEPGTNVPRETIGADRAAVSGKFDALAHALRSGAPLADQEKNLGDKK